MDGMGAVRTYAGGPFGSAVASQEAAVPLREILARHELIRADLARTEADLLVCFSPENIFYLTAHQTPGFSNFQALIFPGEGEPVLLVRDLEAANARANSWVKDIEYYDDKFLFSFGAVAALIDLIRRRDWHKKRIAFEKSTRALSVNEFTTIENRIHGVIDGSGIVEQRRAVKSAWEIEQIRRAATYLDAGMKAAAEAIRVGVTDNDIAAALMSEQIKAGSEYVGMQPYVCVGRRTGIKHATTLSKKAIWFRWKRLPATTDTTLRSFGRLSPEQNHRNVSPDCTTQLQQCCPREWLISSRASPSQTFISSSSQWQSGWASRSSTGSAVATAWDWLSGPIGERGTF